MQKIYNTKNRNCIMEYVEGHKNKCFTAYDINRYMQESGISMNLTTIYRNLERLEKNGSVVRYKTADNEAVMYQYAEKDRECDRHLHMQCRQCGRMYHLECDFMREIETHLMEHHGFLLECQGSLLNGICEECRNKD